MEILYAGLWGVICDTFGFDLASANVICRQLGYPGALRVAYFYEFYDNTGHIWLTNIDCTGNESTVADCPHSGFGGDMDYCTYGQAGVECIGMLIYSILSIILATCGLSCTVYQFARAFSIKTIRN